LDAGIMIHGLGSRVLGLLWVFDKARLVIMIHGLGSRVLGLLWVFDKARLVRLPSRSPIPRSTRGTLEISIRRPNVVGPRTRHLVKGLVS
jgi:hypothetical protein